MIKNRPLTIKERREWSAIGHLLALEAISESKEWSSRDFAFHGGTSLHLSWNSPRFSEDLDFLLDKRAAERLTKVMANVKRHMEERLALIQPGLKVTLADKSRDRLGDFRFTLSKPGVLGQVMVKCEFWKVDPTYLQKYNSTTRSPGVPMDLGGYQLNLSIILPAATLQAAYIDKLTAFATRPFLKMRDVFDFWWITHNAQFEPPRDLAERLLQNLSVYETVDNLPPADALRAFGRRSEEEMMAAAEKDLKPFLSPSMWERFWPDTVRTMVQDSLQGAKKAATVVEEFTRMAPVQISDALDDNDEERPDAPRS